MTSSYLNIINPSTECTNFPPDSDLACAFPFPLDPFQKHAVKGIHEGRNVLVCAKTGSGKTMVGEYLIHHCLKKGQRVFYTTPIKSLSNQKFHDLKQMFPSVGIMTGDIKYKPDAQILIMTTEILRNLLYKENSSTQSLGLTAKISLEGLGGVVFDEVHYINDPERGKVWEETMILLKPEIQLVLLSATIDKPELFASWLGDLKEKPIDLISTAYRVVPLEHYVFLGSQPQLLMDNTEIFKAEAYKRYLDWRKQKRYDQDTKERQVVNRKEGGYDGPVVKGSGLASFTHQMNECVNYLSLNSMMPALFFVFSRNGCESLAKQVQGSLIDGQEAASIHHIWNFHLHSYKDMLEHLPQAIQIKELCMRGIAFHHSGLLPVLREIVELLFGRGLIKCLFATETFAVGINMPTKSVVFLDLQKYSTEDGLRPLRTDEYIQMAGRAGRRGKDKIGYVYYLPQREPLEIGSLQMMMTGKKSPISSRMDFGYDFVMKTLQANNLKWMDLIQHSYWYRQIQAEIQVLDKELETIPPTIQSIEKQMEAVGPISLFDECQKTVEAQEKVRISVNAAKKEAQRVLDTLKNKQLGPKWTRAYELYGQFTKLKEKENKLLLEKKHLGKLHEVLLDPTLKLLTAWGFLGDDNALTNLGILGTEFNEGHPILMPYAYERKWIHDLDPQDFVGFLAAFIHEGKEDEDPGFDELQISDTLYTVLTKIGDYAQECLHEHEASGIHLAKQDFWSLRTSWIEPLQLWYQGETSAAQICQDYGLFEGNFMRSVLKVSNIVEEWVSVATFSKDIPLLNKLEGMKEKLVRDIVKPDSLYLKL